MVPYAKIKEGPGALEPGRRTKRLGPPGNLEAVVLLKNRNNLLPLDKSRLKSIAVVGQRSNRWSPGTGTAARSRMRLLRSMESGTRSPGRQGKLRPR